MTPAAGENAVSVEIENLGNNTRGIRSKVDIKATLEAVWNVLTDHEKFGEIIPSLKLCKLLKKIDNCATVEQLAEQNFGLGLKFKSKMVLECLEKEVEISAYGKKRDIEIKLIEGDFQSFKGKWSIEQVIKQRSEGSGGSVEEEEYQTTLTYTLDVQPKPWMPVSLLEGKLKKEMQNNLLCIREQAQKIMKTK